VDTVNDEDESHHNVTLCDQQFNKMLHYI